MGNSKITISAAVGENAANRNKDVATIQVLLNHYIGIGKIIGFSGLVVDGKIGPKTKKTIMGFQFQNGIITAEHFAGQIRPGGASITFMNKNLGATPVKWPAGKSKPEAESKSDAEAVETALQHIKDKHGLSAAEEHQYRQILTAIWKTHHGKFDSVRSGVGTVANWHQWADFALDIFTLARTGFGASPGSLLYSAGSISWSIGQALGFLGPLLMFLDFVDKLEHASAADARIYGAIGMAYMTTYWAHGGIKPINCRTFLDIWGKEAKEFRSNTTVLENHWKKGQGDAVKGLEAYIQKMAARSGFSQQKSKEKFKALLQTINKTTLSRAVLCSIADSYRAMGDINEADQIQWYGKKLVYPK